jgi:hypothetical protein
MQIDAPVSGPKNYCVPSELLRSKNCNAPLRGEDVEEAHCIGPLIQQALVGNVRAMKAKTSVANIRRRSWTRGKTKRRAAEEGKPLGLTAEPLLQARNKRMKRSRRLSMIIPFIIPSEILAESLAGKRHQALRQRHPR